ncbi:UDP-N-acetylmuramate dehydrogenase [Neptunicella marina]|uniref:UDP-N-acetylenolpyruvoylglucosamine reductase n=1 Tax=Neptunicella marina TaxID=2125989 RepID=A0A8J6J1Y2_9ALTE|nr:UDP-N-acetylmuramate dehydrogenase [Neptunicella marina]
MHNLQLLHTFSLPSQACNLITLESVDSVKLALPLSVPFVLLGQGSNTVFTGDFKGTVYQIKLFGIDVIERENDYILNVAAGESWHAFVQYCLNKEIYGLENLALIPGTVGAAPVQNIGAYGREVSDFIQRVDFIELKSGELKSLTCAQCKFSYRDSIFKHELYNKVVIVNVQFAIPKVWKAETSYGELKELDNPSAKDIFNKVIEVRSEKLPDPARQGNAGSFFKNPYISLNTLKKIQSQWPDIPHFQVDSNHFKVPAAYLIDKLGFKGHKVGNVECHKRQPLVLINIGNATGEELLTIAREIKYKVKSVFGIELENEVRLVGQHGLIDL